ncbi:transcription intermediary factor 1-alpha-like [Xyrichtys novacula]|uniref:Transcription intermediary factor 1-alpha-like n=1 Tax=Xyrichtys novacula TaxID=13765 RepID=A0AAV1F4I8_XYRNO|nr:transcription intermediary factor 1-alpha-like [Xyrichtys novacula]
MEDRTDGRESADAAAVIVVENEAESMQVQEEKSETTEQNYLDICPVCRLNFHSREPKLLPCLHSFCKKCLPPPSRNLAMAEPPNSQVDRTTKPLNVIRCPVCRQECMEVDVMENIFVKDSVEAPSSTVEKSAQLCMTCDDNTEAAGFCVNCVEYLCATCVEAHQRVKFTKDHTIKLKAEASQEVHGGSTLRPMFCDIHKQEPLKLFCEMCDLLTCRDCQLAKHKEHNYQFLEDAYNNHRQHMDNLTQQLQEKKKLIEEVAKSINNGLLQVDQNRLSVHNEIKKSICTLILEINKKGKMLVNQLEAVTKDHESVLRKQQEDIGYLSRHLDHVINFTKWATAKSGGTALLYCKRLILFQIGNLLRAKCSTSFVPQSTARFQCRAAYWASNVDLGSLVVESTPGHQLGGFQGIPHQLPYPGQAPSGSPHSFALGAPHNTLAQLQMQVDKLNPQVHWQPQPPPPPPWMCYQSVRLQRTVPGPLHGGSPGRRFMVPPPNHVSPTSSLLSPGFTPQPLRMLGSSPSYQPKPVEGFSSSPLYTHITAVPINGGISPSQLRHTIEPAYLDRRNDSGGPLCLLKTNYPQSLPPSMPDRNVQGQQCSPGYAAVSQEEKTGSISWKPPETHTAGRAVGSAVKKRRRSSPEPIIVIKDEPDDDSGYVHSNQRVSLPDSTGDQPQIYTQGEPNQVPTPRQSTEDKPHSLNSLRDQSETHDPNHTPSLGRVQQAEQQRAPLKASSEVVCAVCRIGGDLLHCHKCPKVFHLSCHVPTLLKSPSGEWLCSLCCDPLLPEMEYESKPEAKAVKTEPDSDGGFSPVDKRKCERLLLLLFCSDLSSDFKEPVSPSLCANEGLTIRRPVKLYAVKKRLGDKQSACYQSPAEFVADIRLVLGGYESEADTEVIITGRQLKDLFEEHLKTTFPDQTFPEIKQESIPEAPPESWHSFLDNISPPAKHHRKDSQETPSCPGGEEKVV